MSELYHAGQMSQQSLFSDVDYIELQQLILFDPAEDTVNLPQVPSKIKRCGKCKEYKTFANFYRNKNAKPDGLDHHCKICRKGYNDSYRKEHADPRSLDPKRREAHNRQRRGKHLRENPPPIPPEPGHKVCNKCKIEKPLKAFNKSAGVKQDGHAGKCRDCQQIERGNRSPETIAKYKTARDAYEERIREEKRAYDRERGKTPSRQQQQKERYAKRRTRVAGAYIENVNYQRILERDGRFCYICSQNIFPHQRMTFDHVIPLFPRKGEAIGMHTECNLKPAHHECNSRKSNRRFEDLSDYDKRGPGN